MKEAGTVKSQIGVCFEQTNLYEQMNVIDLSVNGLGFSSIILNWVILMIIVVVTALVVGIIVSRLSTRALRIDG